MKQTTNANAPYALLSLLLLLAVENSNADEAPHTKSKEAGVDRPALELSCPGKYQHHLQGVCSNSDAMFWSFTTTLVKTDRQGKLLKKVPVANHHGDLCHHDGNIYVAVNLGKFNDPEGNANSWIYVYEASSLNEVARHAVPKFFMVQAVSGFTKETFLLLAGYPMTSARTTSMNTTASSNQ